MKQRLIQIQKSKSFFLVFKFEIQKLMVNVLLDSI